MPVVKKTIPQDAQTGHLKPPHDGARGYRGQRTWGLAAETHIVLSIACGRRIGKTQFAEFYLYDRGAHEKFQGRVFEAAYGAQGHPQAKEMYETCLADWKAAGLVERHHASEGQDRYVVLKPYGKDPSTGNRGNLGAKVWFVSLDASAAPGFYGKGLDLAIVDEMGQIPPSSVSQVIRPMLMDKDGTLILLGTPYPDGPGFAFFEQMFLMGVLGHETYDPDYCSFNAPSECNPFVTTERINKERAAARMIDPIIERCHYDGLFAKDAGAVFRNLDKVFVLKGEEEEPGLWVNRWPRPGERVGLGIDLGKSHDPSVCSAFSLDTCEQLCVMRMLGDYLPQLERIDQLAARLNRPRIMADARGNETTLELLVRRFGDYATPVMWAAGGKWDKESQIVRAQLMFQTEAWTMIDVLWQRDEFRLYMRTAPKDVGGLRNQSGFKYGAPSGRHDDAVSAAAFALYLLPMVTEKVIEEKAKLVPWTVEWFDALEESQIRPEYVNPFSLRSPINRRRS